MPESDRIGPTPLADFETGLELKLLMALPSDLAQMLLRLPRHPILRHIMRTPAQSPVSKSLNFDWSQMIGPLNFDKMTSDFGLNRQIKQQSNCPNSHKTKQNKSFTLLAQPMKARMATFDEIEIFKIKRHLNFLKAAEGNGTSLLTIMIPGTMGQFHQMRQKLSGELGCASNIKDRVNRQSV
jgi:hypothetical protein